MFSAAHIAANHRSVHASANFSKQSQSRCAIPSNASAASPRMPSEKCLSNHRHHRHHRHRARCAASAAENMHGYMMRAAPGNPVVADFMSARPRPRTPRWNEIENAFGVYLSQASSGKLSPEEALRRTGREISRILERSQ
jgi:hypothetical protein